MDEPLGFSSRAICLADHKILRRTRLRLFISSVIYMGLYISGGAGFLPSTVVLEYTCTKKDDVGYVEVNYIRYILHD